MVICVGSLSASGFSSYSSTSVRRMGHSFLKLPFVRHIPIYHWFTDIFPYMIYARQNNLRVTQWTFQYMVYLVRPMPEIWQTFEKWFSVSRKGVKNEAFHTIILAFKIFTFIVSKITIFAKFSKHYVLSF